MRCANCGSDNADGQKYCGTCGTILEGTTRKCIACGRPLHFDALICPYCGHDYRERPSGMQESPRPYRLLAWGVVLVGIWILFYSASGLIGIDFYYRSWMLLDLGVGILLVIIGFRSLGPKP